MGWTTWFRFPAGAGNFFSLLHPVQTGSRAHPVGTAGSFPGGKADHSTPSSVQVKNMCSYTFTRQYVLMAWCLVIGLLILFVG